MRKDRDRVELLCVGGPLDGAFLTIDAGSRELLAPRWPISPRTSPKATLVADPMG